MKRRATYHLTQAECDRLRRLCETYSQRDAAAIVGCNENTVWNLKRNGWRKRLPPPRPRPNDFGLFKDIETVPQLRARYGVGQEVLYRWFREVGRVSQRHRPRALPIPADLAQTIARVGIVEAAKHYGVHSQTLLKWRREAGLPLRKYRERPASQVGWVERYVAERLAA